MADDPHSVLGAPLLTIPEAAEWCGVHAKTIRRRIKAGKLRALKIGKLDRIHPEDLLASVEVEE